MLRKLLIGLAALIVVLVVLVLARASTFRVERTTRIAAPPDVVFALVNDFHAWDRWSPWAHLDPSMKVTHGGPSSGTGATYHWTGNDKVGEGDMRITESRRAANRVDTPRVHQALREREPHRLHLQARWLWNPGELGDDRTPRLHGQGDGPVRRDGPDDGPGLREGSGGDAARGRGRREEASGGGDGERDPTAGRSGSADTGSRTGEVTAGEAALARLGDQSRPAARPGSPRWPGGSRSGVFMTNGP